MTVTHSAAPSVTTEEGLQRRLSSRQLTMIAIGSAIGVGLFLGSTVTIGLAGPGVIVTYIVGASIALVMGYALAEMAVVHPQAGSFGVYAERYLSPWFGFAVRATYAFIQILAIGAEVTAVAIYFTFWFPAVPQWVWVAIASAGLVAINTAQVGRFGEFEYWFALIKVFAILAFIAVGIALIVGIGPAPAVGLSNLFDGPGGFLPHGWKGVWLALTLVITSYMGVEVVAITAGEAKHPETSIPRAMRSMVLRLIIFYVLAIGVMLMMTPWNQIAEGGRGITGSPFVRAFASAGIPYAAGVMNLVVISAALSSANTNLYLHDPDVVLAVEVWVRTRLALHGQPGRRTAPRAGGCERRDDRSDSPCRSLAGRGLPRAVRHGGRRHALHLDRDSPDLPALPRGAPGCSGSPVCRSGCQRTAPRQSSGSCR